jgi:hypothetical protein
MARAGLSARAVTYLILTYLTADVAVTGGRGGKQDNSTGVLEEMVRQPAGPVLVVLLAAGLLAYAGWRLLQAGAGDGDASGREDLAKRLGWLGIGVVYLGLCGKAVEVMLGRNTKNNSTFSYSHLLTGHAWGGALLVVAGLAVTGGGLGLAVWAILQKFETYLPNAEMPGWVQVLAKVVETYGNTTRGLVFAGVGVTLVVSGWSGAARDAKGVDQALRSLAHHAYGSWVLAMVALGFFCFAATSALEARYREV